MLWTAPPAARRNRFAILLRLMGGLLAGVVAAELLLRVLGISFPRPFLPDPDLGVVLEPNFQGTFCKEGKVFVRINSAGFRDVERSLAKPAGTYRIAVLGDSFTEALQVKLPDTYCSVLENQLKAASPNRHQRFEVLNFGVSGYGTAQQLHLLRKRVWDYDPDLVLLMVYPGNDIHNNYEPLEWQKVRPFYRIENEELIRDNSFRERPDYLVMHQSSWRWKRDTINYVRLLQLASETRTRLQFAMGDANEHGQEHNLFHPTGDWETGWQITERLIAKMHDEVRERGRQFVVAVATVPIQVYPDRAIRAGYAEPNDIKDLFYPHHRIAALAKKDGFPVVSLAEEMQAEADAKKVFFHGFPNGRMGVGHWNETGHRWVAEQILATLKPVIFNPK